MNALARQMILLHDVCNPKNVYPSIAEHLLDLKEPLELFPQLKTARGTAICFLLHLFWRRVLQQNASLIFYIVHNGAPTVQETFKLSRKDKTLVRSPQTTLVCLDCKVRDFDSILVRQLISSRSCLTSLTIERVPPRRSRMCTKSRSNFKFNSSSLPYSSKCRPRPMTCFVMS